MPPTTAARWMIRSGRASASIRSMSAGLRRSYSRLRGTKGGGQPRSRRASTTNEPKKPAPPVTTTRLAPQSSPSCSLATVVALVPRQVGVDHQADQLGESELGRPSQFLSRLRGVTLEEVDLRRTPKARVDDDVPLPVEARVPERQLDELLHRVGLARGDHVIVRVLLLEHEPHGLDVVAGVAPVAPGLEVAEPQLRLETALDARHPVGHLAGDELEAAPRRLVVEQDPAAGEEVVALAIVHRDGVAVHLGDAVRAARVKGRVLVLGRLPHLAEHLAR